MSYYETIEEDLQRAKEILEKGAVDNLTIQPPPPEAPTARGVSVGPQGGTIYGADVYSAYKLLESFTDIIETITPGVCRLIIQAIEEGRRQAIEHAHSGDPSTRRPPLP